MPRDTARRKPQTQKPQALRRVRALFGHRRTACSQRRRSERREQILVARTQLQAEHGDSVRRVALHARGERVRLPRVYGRGLLRVVARAQACILSHQFASLDTVAIEHNTVGVGARSWRLRHVYLAQGKNFTLAGAKSMFSE